MASLTLFPNASNHNRLIMGELRYSLVLTSLLEEAYEAGYQIVVIEPWDSSLPDPRKTPLSAGQRTALELDGVRLLWPSKGRIGFNPFWYPISPGEVTTGRRSPSQREGLALARLLADVLPTSVHADQLERAVSAYFAQLPAEEIPDFTSFHTFLTTQQQAVEWVPDFIAATQEYATESPFQYLLNAAPEKLRPLAASGARVISLGVGEGFDNSYGGSEFWRLLLHTVDACFGNRERPLVIALSHIEFIARVVPTNQLGVMLAHGTFINRQVIATWAGTLEKGDELSPYQQTIIQQFDIQVLLPVVGTGMRALVALDVKAGQRLQKISPRDWPTTAVMRCVSALDSTVSTFKVIETEKTRWVPAPAAS